MDKASTTRRLKDSIVITRGALLCWCREPVLREALRTEASERAEWLRSPVPPACILLNSFDWIQIVRKIGDVYAFEGFLPLVVGIAFCTSRLRVVGGTATAGILNR